MLAVEAPDICVPQIPGMQVVGFCAHHVAEGHERLGLKWQIMRERIRYAVTAVGFLAVAAIAMWVGVQPKKPEKKEEPQPEIDPTQAVLAMFDLPVEVAKQVIKERPVAATIVMAGLGILIARRPQVVLGMVDKLVDRVGGGGNHHG